MAAVPPSPRPPTAHGHGGDAPVPLFLKTDLSTRLVLLAGPDIAIRDLKSQVAMEHAAAFPDLGPVAVMSFQVRRKGELYHLSDSMTVTSAFTKISGGCFLHVKMTCCCQDGPAVDKRRPSDSRLGIYLQKHELPATTSDIASDILPQSLEGGNDDAVVNNIQAHDASSNYILAPSLSQLNTKIKNKVVGLATDTVAGFDRVIGQIQHANQTEGSYIGNTSMANVDKPSNQSNTSHAAAEEPHARNMIENPSGDRKKKKRRKHHSESLNCVDPSLDLTKSSEFVTNECPAQRTDAAPVDAKQTTLGVIEGATAIWCGTEAFAPSGAAENMNQENENVKNGKKKRKRKANMEISAAEKENPNCDILTPKSCVSALLKGRMSQDDCVMQHEPEDTAWNHNLEKNLDQSVADSQNNVLSDEDQADRRVKCKSHARATHWGTPTALLMDNVLSDDVLSDILLCLPSLASLARAAMVSQSWRRLATSAYFLRSFRYLHPSPPLLGCFVSLLAKDSSFQASHAYHTFHPVQIYSDHDLTAAVSGKFFRMGLEESRWRMTDCRGGFVLLASLERFALFNPVSQSHIYVSRPTLYHNDINPSSFHSCLLPPYGDNTHFRLVCLDSRWSGPCVHEYNHGTGNWHLHPSSPPNLEDPARFLFLGGSKDRSSFPSMYAAGRVYWKYEEGSNLLSLATANGLMKFSYVALPPEPDLYREQAPFVVGENEDGACCLVCVVNCSQGHALQVWLRDEEAGSWILHRTFDSSIMHACNAGLRLSKVRRVCAVATGVVLLGLYRAKGRCQYLAFRLKNLYAAAAQAEAGASASLQLEADFYNCRGLEVYPYLMAWPPSSLLQ